MFLMVVQSVMFVHGAVNAIYAILSQCIMLNIWIYETSAVGVGMCPVGSHHFQWPAFARPAVGHPIPLAQVEYVQLSKVKYSREKSGTLRLSVD